VGLAALTLVGAGALWGAVAWLDGEAGAPHRPPADGPRLVEVEPGSGSFAGFEVRSSA